MLLDNHKLELLEGFLPNAYKLRVLGNKPLPPVDVYSGLGTEDRALDS